MPFEAVTGSEDPLIRRLCNFKVRVWVGLRYELAELLHLRAIRNFGGEGLLQHKPKLIQDWSGKWEDCFNRNIELLSDLLRGLAGANSALHILWADARASNLRHPLYGLFQGLVDQNPSSLS